MSNSGFQKGLCDFNIIAKRKGGFSVKKKIIVILMIKSNIMLVFSRAD